MQEQFIPIDIHSNKLSDWLVSRRHGIREWQPQVRVVREKINNALQDMPAHDGIARLLAGTYINYFHCVKIVEILKETEADSRNLFGRYGSQRMKDWLEIVRLYEKDNVYLSEAAQMLTRNVQFEVPSIKRQIAKCEQVQTECEKKVVDLKKQENSARNDFNNSCKKLGIKGDKIKNELIQRCYEIPEMHKKIAIDLPELGSAVELYSAFVRFMFSGDSNQERVPLLKFMIKNGNTTTYEWIHKEKPLKVEEPSLNIQLEDEDDTKNSSEVDFGDGDGIDFGDVKLETGEIDFGDIKVQDEGIDWDASEGGAENEIDFNISLEEAGIEVEDSGHEGGVARGSDALTLFDNESTRTIFRNDLLEVESFLKTRLHEMASAGNNILTLSQLQNAETLLQMQTSESIQAMLSSIQKIIAKLNDPALQHLQNIRHSPRYVDNLAATLKQKLSLVDKYIATQKQVIEKGAQEAQLAQDLRPKLELIIAKTKELQNQIEADISKKYKNRPVNIMGGVNTL